MQANDVRVLKGAAIPTAVVGLVAVVVALLLAGSRRERWARASASLLVGVFFTISLVAVSYAAPSLPQIMMATPRWAAISSRSSPSWRCWQAFGDTTAVEPHGLRLVGHGLHASSGPSVEVRASCKTKMLYVDPEAKVPGRWRMSW